MTDEQDAREAARWFAAALRDEPNAAVDVGAAIQQGDRRLRHRRMWAAGGVAAAVTVGVVGVGLGTRWVGGSTVTPAAVPGCSTVVSTTDPAWLTWEYGPGASWPGSPTGSAGPATGGAGQAPASGDGQPSWATGDYLLRAPLAAVAALPAGVVEFTPTPSPDDHGGDGAPGGQFWMTTANAATTILTVQDADGGRSARLTLGLQGVRAGGPPPCTDTVVRRLVTANGTVVDVSRDGAAGLTARAWYPDGSTTRLTLEPSNDVVGQDTSALPMNDEQLAAVAASPGLSLTG